VPALGRWGISPHADLVYRGLVLSGPATRQQLARRLGIIPARIDAALEELAEIRAVQPVGRSPGRRWHPVDTDTVLSRIRRRREPVRLDDHRRRHLAAVAGLHLNQVPATAINRLSRRSAVRERIAELVAAEKHEHLAINTEDIIQVDAAAAASPLDRALVARGVRLRTLGLVPREGELDNTLTPGIEHRHTHELPLKLMVFDRRSAIFPADPADFDAGAIEIDDATAVASLTELFYRTWNAAENPRGREVPPIVLSAREQKIVALLAAGLSEEAVATELGISRRTVLYALRALMDRLGVENRFQLALVLGAANAVSVPVNPQNIRGER
jgi:DNA-binding CsgD family transcriptional regulator